MAARVTLTVKLTPGKDDDLIQWLASVPKGRRQSIIKTMLRETVPHDSSSVDRSLMQIQQDTSWLREALSELPMWLENLLSNPSALPIQQPVASNTLLRTGKLSTESTTRREKRIAKAAW